MVHCNGIVGSSKFVALRGVPQGSVLGPVLFKILVNVLAGVLADVVRMIFPDDTKLGRSIRAVQDCLRLQDLLDIASDWVSRNGVTIYTKKSALMLFSRQTDNVTFRYSIRVVEIPRCENQRDLGVIFDCGLSFRSHVCRIVCDCSRYLGVIFSLSEVFGHWEPLRLLFIMLVRSRLLYASVTWASCAEYLFNKLNGVQRRFVFFIYACYFYGEVYSYESLLRRLRLVTVKDSLYFCDIMFLRFVVRGETSMPGLVSSWNFRVPRSSCRAELFYDAQTFGVPFRLAVRFT